MLQPAATDWKTLESAGVAGCRRRGGRVGGERRSRARPSLFASSPTSSSKAAPGPSHTVVPHLSVHSAPPPILHVTTTTPPYITHHTSQAHTALPDSLPDCRDQPPRSTSMPCPSSTCTLVSLLPARPESSASVPRQGAPRRRPSRAYAPGATCVPQPCARWCQEEGKEMSACACACVRAYVRACESDQKPAPQAPSGRLLHAMWWLPGASAGLLLYRWHPRAAAKCTACTTPPPPTPRDWAWHAASRGWPPSRAAQQGSSCSTHKTYVLRPSDAMPCSAAPHLGQASASGGNGAPCWLPHARRRRPYVSACTVSSPMDVSFMLSTWRQGRAGQRSAHTGGPAGRHGAGWCEDAGSWLLA